MKVRWPGLLLVVTLVAMILVAKYYKRAHTEESCQAIRPALLMVADPSEAGDANDICAEMIRLVRSAGQRGVPVRELSPNSDLELLKRYHVLTTPTVLVLDDKGNELERFEGEAQSTLEALRSRLVTLERGKR